MKTKGVTVAKTIDKLGNHCSDTAQIFFEDVVVPRKNIIGEEGKGFTYQMMQFQEERLWGTASSEGVGREEEDWKYVCYLCIACVFVLCLEQAFQSYHIWSYQ